MRYLTKSRFKQALECPDKLFYSGKKEYAGVRKDNEFLRELAKGGMQVGELAKCYFPGGIEITAPDNTTALADTQKYLQQENVTLFEAAIAFENLLVRVDVLVKKGNVINLYEVKAKSYETEDELFKKNGEVKGDFKEYVYDIAFQTYVVRKALPGLIVHGSLMLVNKGLRVSVDGLFQKFLVRKVDGRYKVFSKDHVEFGEPILSKIDLDNAIDGILNDQHELLGQPVSFDDYVQALSEAYNDDRLLNAVVSKACKTCEYRAAAEHKSNGYRSGFEECWTLKAKFTAEDFLKPHVFEVWFGSNERYLNEGRYFLSALQEADFPSKGARSKRQWMQVERTLNPSLGSYVDRPGIAQEIRNLNYPLHFIDFEAARNAIPYVRGLRPYAQIAFQFSHHAIDEQGNLSHQEWINTKAGHYPNFDFVRALKRQLEHDNGSIFIYSHFENSVLNNCYETLKVSNESDKIELMDFIRSITRSTEDDWVGPRSMIDMMKWVLDYYYSPLMKGSNSIKDVLPAILNDSKYVQEKYPEWVKCDISGKIISPYKLLPPVFDDFSRSDIEDSLLEDAELNDGGAAMCAYNLMQYAEMSDRERELIVQALLKYCKLDTLAMVMLFEGLKNL